MHKYMVLFFLGVLSSGAFAEKQYFAIFMNGQKIGYSTFNRAVDGPKVTTTNTVEISVTRLGMPIKMQETETTIESTTGEPLGFESVLEAGLGKQIARGRITKDGKINLISSMGKDSQKQVLDWPEGAIMNEGVRLLQLKAGLKAGTFVKAKVFVPSTLSAVDANIKIIKAEKVDLLGRVVNLLKVETIMNLPEGSINSTSFVDSDLIPQKSIMPVMGMNLEMVACNKQFALSKNDVVDFIDKSLVSCPVSLVNGDNAKSITYTLKPINGAKINFLSGDNQLITKLPDGTVELKAINLKGEAGANIPYAGNDANAVKALKPSRYVQSNEKAVIDLAKKAVGNASDAAQAAENISSFVRDYISDKNFSIGYGSALEVIQSKEGDCSEHAVLTAALAKASGIPAQVVFGMLYANEVEGRKDVFVGHAWTRCFINGKWVDYDATKHSVGPTRIAMAAGDGDPDQFFGILSTFGNFKIVDAKVQN